MALNPQYEDIATEFVQQYYGIFDDQENRDKVINFYSATESFMTFEGDKIQGAPKILEKVQSLGFENIRRVINTVDSQPTFDGGVLIKVLGCLQCDDDPVIGFSQVFVLKVNEPTGSYFIAHDIFRLDIHNSA
ncbi:probable nuclear transport factor 2 [Drosophila innubila]|uniref:probable nuclear transport factor 2 n=1 Tax=Drosophila innubila TaxID=198719 RepID=UPI00148E6E91|nr:probable nuclear transport factor 2 [Drosophila innubila]